MSDPIIVAVENQGATGIFNPETLALVQRLSDEIAELPNVDASRVISLATENNISSSVDGVDIKPFFEPFPENQEQAEAVRNAVSAFPIYLGTLVAKDHSVTLIVVELVDELQQESSYQNVMELVQRAPADVDTSINVAGEAALAGYLGQYIESDAKRLNPMAWLIICMTIFIAYRRLNPVLMANVIIAASILITLGAMAAIGVPFYMITTVLPVILIGISVADSIHIYSHYYTLQAKYPEMDTSSLTVATMVDMWRPVTLTTLTTMAGFLGLYLAAYMPPFKYFGLFAAFGVLVAWVYSMIFLPAAIVLTKPQGSRQFSPDFIKQNSDIFGKAMAVLGYVCLRYTTAVIVGFVLLCGAGLYAATHLTVDENPINIFDPSEPIYLADAVINRHMDGANALDIVVETPNAEDLFEPENLRKIEALQVYASTLPRVGGSTSIVDYLKQMNKSLNGGEVEEYRLPESKEMTAQYFLLYSAISDPTDFEEEIDYDYQTANIRINVNSGYYQDFKFVVESLQHYVDTEFNGEGIKATLSGRVTLNYHWIRDLGRSHYVGLVLALLLVGGVSAALFRSLWGGIYTLIPVAASVLLVYAAMVISGMTLGVGTSMFAALAIGLGVDFSIHTLDRLKALFSEFGGDTGTAYNEFYQTTGRALLINFLAIACGFGVLVSSKVASLNQLGGILVIAVSSSFIASLTILPVLVKVFQPGFVSGSGHAHSRKASNSTGSALSVLLAASLIFAALPGQTAFGQEQEQEQEQETMVRQEQEPLTAEQLVSLVNGVDEGEFVTRKLQMVLTDRRGKQRSRQTINYRKYFGNDKRTVLFYLQPANVRDTGFLVWDYADPSEEDDQWLFLPALRKVRRISASDRGDYFLGTDFTYEDMKLDGKLAPKDYNYVLLGEESLDGVLTYKLEGIPKTENIARELGYSRIVSWVNPENWMITQAEFEDLKGQALKSLRVEDIRQVNGLWTRHQLTMRNHLTEHESKFTFSDVDYTTPVPDSLFSKQALARGH